MRKFTVAELNKEGEQVWHSADLLTITTGQLISQAEDGQTTEFLDTVIVYARPDGSLASAPLAHGKFVEMSAEEVEQAKKK